MAEHRLVPMPPLGGPAPRGDRLDGLEIFENTEVDLASVSARGDASALATAAAEIGMPLPDPGKLIVGAEFTVFWTAPRQWFVEAPVDTDTGLEAILAERLGAAASITEQTDAWARIDLSGKVVALLERLCPLDAAAMQSDAAARSFMENIGVFLLCREAGARFSVLGPRSSAASLHHAILTAARSVV